MAMTDTAASETAPLRRHSFTVAEWEQIVESGALGDHPRVELLDGEVVDMSPISPWHHARVLRALRLFARLLGDAAIVSPQGPIRLNDRSLPEPDIAILRARADLYAGRHATPEDVLLVLEVSDSTRQYDLRTKAAAYARAGIADYWVEDLAAGTLIVHREPSIGGYRSVQTLDRDATLVPLAFADTLDTVAELLG